MTNLYCLAVGCKHPMSSVSPQPSLLMIRLVLVSRKISHDTRSYILVWTFFRSRTIRSLLSNRTQRIFAFSNVSRAMAECFHHQRQFSLAVMSGRSLLLLEAPATPPTQRLIWIIPGLSDQANDPMAPFEVESRDACPATVRVVRRRHAEDSNRKPTRLVASRVSIVTS